MAKRKMTKKKYPFRRVRRRRVIGSLVRPVKKRRYPLYNPLYTRRTKGRRIKVKRSSSYT